MEINIKDKAKKAGKVVKKTVFTLNLIVTVIFFAFIVALIIVNLVREAHGETINLGVYGKTYRFREKNLLSVIKNKAKHINWQEIIKKSHIKRQVENYQPYNQEVSLPTALNTKVFEPSMYYTLKFNIKNSKGNIIYPKGFRYKITDYIFLNNFLIVINGDSKKQVEWFKHSKYRNNIAVMLMITKGDYYKLAKKLGIPVYFYMKALQKRFKLKAVPSVIWQKGTTIYVKQYGKNAVYQSLKNIKKNNKTRKILKESGLLNPNYR
jgi:conjugal transfer pilus assembly protein TraW